METINDRLIAKHLASKGGSASSPEHKREAGRLGGLASAAARRKRQILPTEGENIADHTANIASESLVET
jgi:hypothetical protein